MKFAYCYPLLGKIYLLPDFFELTPEEQEFVWLHEVGHCVYQTYDEKLADRYALENMDPQNQFKVLFFSFDQIPQPERVREIYKAMVTEFNTQQELHWVPAEELQKRGYSVFRLESGATIIKDPTGKPIGNATVVKPAGFGESFNALNAFNDLAGTTPPASNQPLNGNGPLLPNENNQPAPVGTGGNKPDWGQIASTTGGILVGLSPAIAQIFGGNVAEAKADAGALAQANYTRTKAETGVPSWVKVLGVLAVVGLGIYLVTKSSK